MKILVTGGLGFVGINLVRGLAERGLGEVIAADLSLPGPAEEAFLEPVRACVRCCLLDVRDRAALAALLKDEAVTHVVHAAAITVSGEAERSQADTIVAVNLESTLHLLAAALHAPALEKVLLVSSSGVYGTPVDLWRPQREEGPLDLTSLYALTKYSAELFVAHYAGLSGKAMAAVRLPAVYGPQERIRASRPHTSAIHQLFAALRASRAVRVAGPEVARDWTYTADIAAGVAALLAAPRWQQPVYNLSCGLSISFAEVVETFRAAGLQATWVADAGEAEIAMRPHQNRAPLDISRIRQEIGYEPLYSLSDGLKAWQQVSNLGVKAPSAWQP